jgi:hypothetical protein
MNLSIESFDFHVGSLGTLCLSDPISSGSLAHKTAAVAPSETSVGSSSEANLRVSIKPAKIKKSIIDPLDEIMDFDFKESLGQSLSDYGLEKNSNNIRNYSEEDFIARYSSVSYGSEDEWMAGLELYDDEPTIFSEPNYNTRNQHQVCVIIDKT